MFIGKDSIGVDMEHLASGNGKNVKEENAADHQSPWTTLTPDVPDVYRENIKVLRRGRGYKRPCKQTNCFNQTPINTKCVLRFNIDPWPLLL